MADVGRIPAAAVTPLSETSAGTRPGERGGVTRTATATSFGEMLRARQGVAGSSPPVEPSGDLRFSAHAQTRLQSRNIALDGTHIARLEGAVQKAAGKGSRDALVLMDDLAMVVSVRNRTVITVVDKESMKQNVFTNIDSAVIA